jgi:hypothetical protein
MLAPADALRRTSTVPVGESMPVAIGGIDVRSAIHTPPTEPPISIAQMAVDMPAWSSPGNRRAPNETMLAISTTAPTRPATVSRRPSRLAAAARRHAAPSAALRAPSGDPAGTAGVPERMFT